MSRELRVIGFFAFIAIACLLFMGQNNGTTGTFTVSQTVTYVGSGSGPYISSVCPPLKSCQSIFTNVGQSAHFLHYCSSSGFTGTIDLEESFDGVTNWTPIAYASFLATPLPANGCGILQAGGYYQNIRSVVNNVVAGTVTADYNASSGPIAFTPVGIGPTGSTSPTVCNQSKTLPVGSGATVLLVPEVLASTIRVCAYQITAAQTSNGAFQFQSSTGANSCTGLTDVWDVYSIGGTPEVFALGNGVGQIFSALPLNSLCVTNSEGQAAYVNIAYASVANGF